MSENENEVKVLGPEVGYTDLLDLEIAEKIKEDADGGKKKYFPLRPSSAGYCARRLAYDLMEYSGKAKYEKEPITPTVFRLLNLGHSIEYSALRNLEMLQGIDLRYKQQVVSLFRLDSVEAGVPGPLIEGSVDVVLWSEKYKAVLDVKSQKDGFSVAYKSRWDETLDKFNQMTSLVRIGESAYYADDLGELLDELNGDWLCDNLYQLNLYACSDFLRERGIDHAVIYKYGKNDSRHYEIRFRPSMEIYEETKRKYNEIYNAVMVKGDPELVERESFLGSSRCAFCPYQMQCWKTNALKEFFKSTPKQWPTDLRKVKDNKHLSKLFTSLEKLEKTSKDKTDVEAEIMEIMQKAEIKKIRLDNGRVYELKFYKSPREHFELRRSKA